MDRIAFIRTAVAALLGLAFGRHTDAVVDGDFWSDGSWTKGGGWDVTPGYEPPMFERPYHVVLMRARGKGETTDTMTFDVDADMLDYFTLGATYTIDVGDGPMPGWCCIAVEPVEYEYPPRDDDYEMDWG